jgi:plastocyanin
MGTSAFSKLLVGSLALAAVAGAPVASAAPGDPAPIAIDNFAFAPEELTAPVGTSITWTNAQPGVPHTTSSVDAVWDSGTLASGGTFTFTFSQPGDFAYQCLIHPSMRGLVHIVAPAETAAPVAESAESIDAVDSADAEISSADLAPSIADPETSAADATAAPPVSTAIPVAPAVPTPTPTTAATAVPTATPRVAPAAAYPTPTPTVRYGY